MPEPVATESTATSTTVPATSTTVPVSDSSTSAATVTTPSKFSYDEDRSAWIPPTKFRSVELATNRAAREAEQLRGELAAERRRVAALAGVQPTDPAATETESVKEAFFQMFPQAKKLFQTDPERLEQMLASGAAIEEDNRSRWDDHRDKVLDTIAERVATLMGVEKLGDKARRKVVAAFKASIPDQAEDPTAYDAWAKRYQRADPKLLDEFVQEFEADFITPAKRQGLVRPRVMVPSGGSSHPVVKTEPKPKPGNLDAAMERYVRILRDGVPA